jgi:hypothetical protein
MLYVKDAEVCTYQIDVEITEPEELTITAPTSTDETCFSGINGVHDGTITAGTITGGNGEFEYSIDNSTFQSEPLFEDLAAGNYTVFIKDKEGCATQSNITVGSLSEMKATLTKTDIKCFGESTGAINLNSPTGGSGSYEYQIIDNNNPTGAELWVTTPEITNLKSGGYQVNIRDINHKDCIVTLNNSYTLLQPNAALAATTSATRTLNYGSPTGSVTATATGGSGGYTYEWRVLGQINVIQSTKTANSLSAGDYELTVYDINGCSTVESVTIIDVVKAEISETSRCLQNTDEIRTSSFQLDPDLTVGGIGDPYKFKYEWNFGASASPASAQGLDRFEVEYSSKGDKVITLTITDSLGLGVVSVQKFDHYVGGCFEGCRGENSSQDFQMDKDNYFIGDIDGNRLTDINCATVTPKYLWIDIKKSSNVYVLDVELIYSTTVSNPLNLSGVATDSGQLTGCFGTKIPVTNGNGNGNGNGGNTEEWEIIPIGLYPLFLVDSAQSNTNIEWECGESFSVDQIRIRWTTNSGKECGDATGNSCIDSKEIVPVSVPLFANADVTDTPCHGTALGSMVINAYGGVKPYTYSITGDITENYVLTKEFYNLAVGSYEEVYVRDSKGTTYYFDPDTKPIIVNQPEVLTLEVKKDAPIKCFGESTTATATVTGGTLPYTYLWNDVDSQDATQAEDLKAGSYTVTVTDANECQEIATVIIEEPVELTAPFAGNDQTFNCGIISTSLLGNTPEIGEGKWVIKSGSGGSFPDGDETDPLASFTGEANTIYKLDWTIANPDGTCLKSDEVIITFTDDCSALDFDGVDDHVNFGDNHNFPTGNFTLETWVKLNSIVGVRTVLSKRNASNLGAGGYDLIINNGAPTFRWGNISVSTSSKLSTSRWYHLAVSYNGEKYVLYVDGLDVGTKTGVNPLLIDSPFIIGAMYNRTTPEVPSNYFHGWIEELRIWNKALSESQIHFMMNQRLKILESPIGTTPITGTVLPLEVPGALTWASLQGYYQLIAADVDVANGITLDETSFKINGILKNIDTNQDNSAPLPYISSSDGDWNISSTWLRPDVWEYPNANGINGEKIDWNIARISNKINSNSKDITLLGLISEKANNLPEDSKLNMEGSVPNNTGNGLTITHYLKLDGIIDLNGESQLVQTEGSILEDSSSGYIERDQQGKRNSYVYNYWSSPVSTQGTANNAPYNVKSVLMDGTTASNPQTITFDDQYWIADGGRTSPITISTYWLWGYSPAEANIYAEWDHILEDGPLYSGEGFTMKGTDGTAGLSPEQNYTFRGKPHNGDILLQKIAADQNYMIGNPYPSAIDANKFILDNLNSTDVGGATNTTNNFNGALYFWDHFAIKTHILAEYVGGYATRNLIDGVPAASTDERINANDAEGTKIPGQFIPVAQGFFINSSFDPNLSENYTADGGDVIFKNSQRAFEKEANPGNSQFLRPETNSQKDKQVETRSKIRLDFKSPMGYNRQILVGSDPNTTNGFDLGYDAQLNDNNLEDMFWLINNIEFVIQGVPNFGIDQVLPLGIKINEAGVFSIKINKLENIAEDVNIYLKNLQDSTYFDLRNGDYSMNLDPGNYYERFQIVFKKEKVSTEEPDPIVETEEESEEEVTAEEEQEQGTDGTAGEEEILDGEIKVFYVGNSRELAILNPSKFKIERIVIYDMLGQIIQEYQNISNEKEVRLPVREFPAAVYAIKLYSGNKEISKNIILIR